MSGDRSRRGSALLNELSRAEAKIGTLEDFIREREQQLHVAVSRLSRGTGGRRRSRQMLRHGRRRAGITQDALLRMRTMSQESIEHPDDGTLSTVCALYVHEYLVQLTYELSWEGVNHSILDTVPQTQYCTLPTELLWYLV